MGLLRMVLGAAVVWVVWRLLDGMLAGTRSAPAERPTQRQKPDESRVGEYVDFEELED